MSRYFILIKKKGSSKYLGAIPAKRGVTKARLAATIPRAIKKGYSFKIVTSEQLKRFLKAKVAGVSVRRRVKRRRLRRRPVRRVRRRIIRRRRKR